MHAQLLVSNPTSFPPLKPSPNLEILAAFFQISHEILWGVIWGGNLQKTLAGKELRFILNGVLAISSAGDLFIAFFF